MSDVPRPRVTLADHNAVVQRWQARAAAPVHSRLDPARQTPASDKVAVDWLQAEETKEDEEDDQQTAAEEAPPEHDGAEDAEPCDVRSVGLIKHAFRTRARREEAANERKALQRQADWRKTNGVVAKPLVLARAPVSVSSATSPQPEARDGDRADATVEAECDPIGTMRLDAFALVTNGASRADVLRAVRRELSAGQNVLLVVQSLATAPLADVKLAVQQLCAESLLFCDRDQNVVPSVDHDRGIVTLELLARRRQQS